MYLYAGVQLLCSSTFMLLVSSTLAKAASSYMRAHGTKELWPYFRIRCELICPYGYQTDVEGNYVCLCYNPCENVLCFGNTKCVVDLPKACLADDCRPLANCKDFGVSSPFAPASNSLLLADDATTTSSDSSVPDRCFLSVEDEAKQCRRTKMRWFYDDVTGTCKQFLGCKTKGNNFRGKRGCEKTCLVTKSSKKNRSRPPKHQADEAKETTKLAQEESELSSICTLPAVPVTTGCDKLRKRWFFDKDSGECRMFRGCSTPGNNFSKKKHCKSRCLGKKSRRREKRYLSRFAKQ